MLKVTPFTAMGSVVQLIKAFGGKEGFEKAVHEMQAALYQESRLNHVVRTTVKSIQDIMRQDAGVDGDAQRISQLSWMFFLKIIDDQDQELELTRTTTARRSRRNSSGATWAADPEGITGEALLDFINDELFPALKSLKSRPSPAIAAAWSAMCSRTPTTT